LCACLFATAAVLSYHRFQAGDAGKAPVTAKSIFFRIHYIRERRNILAPSRSIFSWCVRRGNGAAAAYAEHFHTGPWGLGLLRLAPAVGALSTAVFLAHHHRNRAGHRMFGAVIVFGVATVAFALSRNVWI